MVQYMTSQSYQTLEPDNSIQRYKKQHVIKTCLYCNKKFEVPPSREKTAKFCSATCQRKGREKNIPWKKINPTKEELEKLYCLEKLSTIEIAKQWKVCPATINYWLRKYNLNRSISEAIKLAYAEGRLKKVKLEKTKEKISTGLKRAYLEGRRKPWNKGRKLSEEHRRNISRGVKVCYEKGLINTLERNKRISKTLKGRKIPLKTREKISHKLKKLYKEGKLSVWNKNKKLWYTPPNAFKTGYGLKEFDLSNTPAICYILGVLEGDGSAYIVKRRKRKEYYVCLCVIHRKFALSFYNALKAIGLAPWINQYRNVWKVYSHSKKFVEWYKQLTFEDIKTIVSTSKVGLISFLKGFYESEGCYRRDRRALFISNTNHERSLFVKSLLEKLGFHPTITYRRYGEGGSKTEFFVNLNRKKEITTFLDLVKPCIKNGGK